MFYISYALEVLQFKICVERWIAIKLNKSKTLLSITGSKAFLMKKTCSLLGIGLNWTFYNSSRGRLGERYRAFTIWLWIDLVTLRGLIIIAKMWLKYSTIYSCIYNNFIYYVFYHSMHLFLPACLYWYLAYNPSFKTNTSSYGRRFRFLAREVSRYTWR